TPEFLRLTLFVILIDSMTNPMSVAIQATGKVRDFSLIVGAILSLDLPVAYLVLKSGGMPYTVMYVSILTSAICLFVRLMIMKRGISYSARRFFVDVFLKNILLTGLSLAVLSSVKRQFPDSIPSLLLVSLISIAFVGTAIYAGCLTRGERMFIREKIAEKIVRNPFGN
ncbi:MAG: hypothetical protein LBB73_09370, partial [Dysgonamonadaceae bacterium]|nr:hypothetical protein [Dysgonamonadaceae bacterium]